MPSAVPRNWQQLVVELRRYRMTGARIAAFVGIPRSTVARILKAARTRASEVPRPPSAHPAPREAQAGRVNPPGRKEARPHPVDQAPHHQLPRGAPEPRYRLGIRTLWFDDHIRLAHVETIPDEKGLTAVAFRIRRVMTSNGSC